MERVILSFGEYEKLARRVARKAGVSYSRLNVSRFPDSESYVRFRSDIRGKSVYILQSLHPANEKLMDVLLAGYTAKELGARRITLIAPYLAYMRQDKRFKEGEAVSARIVVGRLLSVYDKLITIDPHLHRIKKMSDVFPNSSRVLTANDVLASFIKRRLGGGLIIGPDGESFQWARSIAKKINLDVVVLKKERYSAERVRIKLSSEAREKIRRDRNAVIVDDIISTGHTVIETVRKAKELGMLVRAVVCVHGVFAEDAYKKIRRTGVKEIYSTNTIVGEHSSIDVSGLIAGSLNNQGR